MVAFVPLLQAGQFKREAGMKQSDRFNDVKTTTQFNPDTTSDPKWIGKYRAAILGSSLMLVGLLGIYGCTKKSEQPTAVVSPNPPAAPSAPVLPVVATDTNQPVAAKRIVQRSSPTATYANDAYGISFRYPLSYKLKAWDVPAGDAKPAALKNSVDSDPAEVPLATVQMPQSMYPKTDFDDGYFSVSANRSLTEETCQQSAIINEDSKVLSETVNGVQFHWTENSTSESDYHSEWRSYAGFANGICYQVQLGLATSVAPDPADRSAVKEVNSARVFARLNSILSSLKIHPVAVPAVALPARASSDTPSVSPNSPVVAPAGNATIGQSTAPAADAANQQ
jgi:hypothetical protein